MDSNTESNTPAREMPRYKCHKEVHALKIGAIGQAAEGQERQHAGGDWYLVPEDTGYGPICVGHDEYVVKHKPQPGGYYVVYDDGYKSYSPAAPFEAGYTLIVPEAPSNLPPHQQRVLVEREELHTRLGKLRGFIGTDTFNALDPAERDRLERQEHFMHRYLQVLDERTATFGA